MKSLQAPLTANPAGSVLAQSAWKRVLFALGMLALLWVAIAWAVAVP